MYQNMAELLSPSDIGDFKLDIFEITKNNIGAMVQGIAPGRYARLKHNGETVMSDTDMERRTNREFIHNAYGDVLIGGLGIGMIVLAIQNEASVKSITIIEKHIEVIEMITKQIAFNEKVKIVNADVFDWKPDKGIKYDCIYMDIWNWINEDIYREQMKPLKRKYGHYLKPAEKSPHRFNSCWAEYHAKTGRRLY